MRRRRESELDRDLAALLATMAFAEIRHLAGTPRHASGDGPEETLEHLRFLTDLAHNLPGVARPRPPGEVIEQLTGGRPLVRPVCGRG